MSESHEHAVRIANDLMNTLNDHNPPGGEVDGAVLVGGVNLLLVKLLRHAGCETSEHLETLLMPFSIAVGELLEGLDHDDRK